MKSDREAALESLLERCRSWFIDVEQGLRVEEPEEMIDAIDDLLMPRS